VRRHVPLVIGVDAGATTTRCVVATVDGEIVAAARGPGANRWSSGGDHAERLAAVVARALTGLDPGRVVAGFLGVAGAGGSVPRDPAVGWWTALGLTGTPSQAGDAVVAYAAGSVEPEGLLLLSGTGATAAWVRDFAIRHRCDGVGWWLGDEGSAVWLARAAVRAALRALDGRGSDTTLVAGVADGLLAERAQRLRGRPLLDALTAAVYEDTPAALGRIAPIVDAHARAGDAVATAIAEEAARRLLATLAAVARIARDAGADSLPVVLAGSVLLTGSLVAELVTGGVAETYGVQPRAADEGAAGAAALAVRRALADPAAARAAHARLLRDAVGLDYASS
jgi:N-acetylglucosamine kinase-like BadF-type ATPase